MKIQNMHRLRHMQLHNENPNAPPTKSRRTENEIQKRVNDIRGMKRSSKKKADARVRISPQAIARGELTY